MCCYGWPAWSTSGGVPRCAIDGARVQVVVPADSVRLGRPHIGTLSQSLHGHKYLVLLTESPTAWAILLSVDPFSARVLAACCVVCTVRTPGPRTQMGEHPSKTRTVVAWPTKTGGDSGLSGGKAARGAGGRVRALATTRRSFLASARRWHALGQAHGGGGWSHCS